MGDALVL
jgi:hypothetical protein